MSDTLRHIVFVLSGLGAGGAEKAINLIARHRQSHGDRVSVLAFHDRPEDSYFAYPETIDLFTMEAESGPGGVVSRLFWLRRNLESLSPDLVVSFLTKINVLTLLASMGRRWPVVVSERNNPIAQPSHPAWAWLTRATMARATALVMQTEAARKTLPATVARRACVIGNPCTLVHQRARVGDAGVRFVAVGRLTAQKGFDTMIEAFASLYRGHPEARMMIFGEGSDRAALQEQVNRLELNAAVSLPGVSETPGAWIDLADSFVLASRYEGFPNVVAEAMTAGLAVIATDCDWGPADLIDDGKTGLLVPVDDVAALAGAMERVFVDAELRTALGDAAHQSAANRFTLAENLRQWDMVIDRTMGVTNG